MTDCNRLKDHLYDYVDDLLARDSRQQLEQHLKKCPECATVLQNLKLVRSQLSTLRPLKTSSDFDMILRTRIKMERSLHKGGFSNWPVRLPIYAASAALVILVAFFVFDPNASFRGKSSERVPSTFASGVQTPQSDNSYSETVVFPIDIIDVGDGVRINSETSRLRKQALVDSSRNRFQGNVQAVEF